MCRAGPCSLHNFENIEILVRLGRDMSKGGCWIAVVGMQVREDIMYIINKIL